MLRKLSNGNKGILRANLFSSVYGKCQNTPLLLVKIQPVIRQNLALNQKLPFIFNEVKCHALNLIKDGV